MFVKYDTNGQITRICGGEKEFAPHLPGHVWFDADVDIDLEYIDLTDPDNPTPTERPASPVSRTGPTLLDVPTGSTLHINGVSYPAEGEVEVLFTYPGTYALRVECFPYLDWTDEVVIP